MAVESVTYLAAASCVVHNICELRRDDFFQEWLQVCNNIDYRKFSSYKSKFKPGGSVHSANLYMRVFCCKHCPNFGETVNQIILVY